MSAAHPYVRILRVDHWFKNVFVLPGTVVALALGAAEWPLSAGDLARCCAGLLAVCLTASANYVLNEWLDARYDRYHPVKRERAAAQESLRVPGVLSLYVGLLAVSAGLAFSVSASFLWVLGLFALMGIAYNVEPIRLKDRPFLDALAESANNPIRLLAGWFLLADTYLPPSSLLLGYWAGGGFLMTLKRYAELRHLGRTPELVSYRKVFARYTPETLLLASYVYSMVCAFFVGVFLIKYRVEYLLSLPFLAILMSWYFWIGLLPDSAAQYPERLFRHRMFMLYFLLVGVLLIALLFVDVPGLDRLLGTGLVSLGGGS
ncbi:MAG: hypothetical protein MOGMAGMI_01441 [Candidatus Omnitrophica bacterium]|nr:hypothetical protein [Candidatus Omnitrophota bacterium]